MTSNVKLVETQRALLMIWGVGFSVCLLVMLMMTAAGTFGAGVHEAWSWFMPTLLPTVSMTLSSAIAPAEGKGGRVGPRFVARLAKSVSIFYLALVVITLLAWPLTNEGPLKWFQTSGLWMGPIQGVVGAVLAVFLTGQVRPTSSPPTAAEEA